MKKLIISAAIAASSMAHASFFTGNDLFEKLNSDTDAAWGMMYIAGVADAGLGWSAHWLWLLFTLPMISNEEQAP